MTRRTEKNIKTMPDFKLNFLPLSRSFLKLPKNMTLLLRNIKNCIKVENPDEVLT